MASTYAFWPLYPRNRHSLRIAGFLQLLWGGFGEAQAPIMTDTMTVSVVSWGGTLIATWEVDEWLVAYIFMYCSHSTQFSGAAI